MLYWETSREKPVWGNLLNLFCLSMLCRCSARTAKDESSPCRVRTSFLCISSSLFFPSAPISHVIWGSGLALLNAFPEGFCLLTVLVHSLFYPLFLYASFSSRLLPHTPHKAQAWLSQAGRTPALYGLWLLLLTLGLNRQVYRQRLFVFSPSLFLWQDKRFHHKFINIVGWYKTWCTIVS